MNIWLETVGSHHSQLGQAPPTTCINVSAITEESRGELPTEIGSYEIAADQEFRSLFSLAAQLKWVEVLLILV